MKPPSLALVVFFVILGTAWVCHREQAIRRQLATDRIESRLRVSRASAEGARLSQRLLENEKSIAGLKDKLAAAAREPTPKTLAISPNAQQRLDNDPNLQILDAKARRNAIQSNYSAFMRSRNLSPTQAAAFENALLRRDEDQNDAMAVMRAKGLSPRDPAIGSLVRQSMDAYKETQTQLLGGDGYKALEDFDRTLRVREMLAGLAGNATAEGIYFPAAQADKMIPIIAASSASYRAGGWAAVEEVDWRKVDAQAQQFLSPEQFWAFQNLPSIGLHSTNSRGISRLNAAIDQAVEADQKNAGPAKSSGG